MPENAPSPRSPVMDLMALRSVTELPVTRRHVLDPEVLRTVAVVDRVGDLTRFNVAEVPELAQLSGPEELTTRPVRDWTVRSPARAAGPAAASQRRHSSDRNPSPGPHASVRISSPRSP